MLHTLVVSYGIEISELLELVNATIWLFNSLIFMFDKEDDIVNIVSFKGTNVAMFTSVSSRT